MSGVEDPVHPGDKKTWKLHLKNPPLLNIEKVRTLTVAHEATKIFLEKALRYLEPTTFEGFRTSTTIKATQLRNEDIEKSIEMGKFELATDLSSNPAKLPPGFHGVNAFSVCEMKGRRRLITEPHLNEAVDRTEIPKIVYPTRLARRQSLRKAKYMLQIDFEAFYDAIPLPESVRNKFVFRKGNRYYRLKTLPTGARWSVAIGQGVTWTIVDIPTTLVIHTMIDNIMIAAKEGEEDEFFRVVREVLRRIGEVNLATSPDRQWLESLSKEGLLREAEKPNTFIGEEYAFEDGERWVRNSVKTVAKMELALEASRFSCRSFVSLISLQLYALHTTRLNPASAFKLMRAYRGVYRKVVEGVDWDAELPYMDPSVYSNMLSLGRTLCTNEWWVIADEYTPTYNEEDYNYVIYTDASYGGWGAISQHRDAGTTMTYQQRWNREFYDEVGPPEPGWILNSGFFNAQHSAHAEPRAAELAIQQEVRRGMRDGARIALVTDHEAIVHAQRRTNGFGGIGRGYSLNRLFEYVYNLEFERDIRVTFFYISGPSNPADALSRNFGDESANGMVVWKPAPTTMLPSLNWTFSPVCEGMTFKSSRKKY